MRIIHISDFHISADKLEDLHNYVVEPLIKDLIDFNNEKEIDLIAFSGDLIDKGGISFGNDIELAFYTFQVEVIEPLLNALDLPAHRFFFIPGNHDIVRSADSNIIELGLKSALVDSEKVNAFIDAENEEGIKRILPFKKFEQEYFREFDGDYQFSNFQSAFKWEAGNKQKVGLTCFNTSWRCYDTESDHKNIILGERQITRARDFIEECDIKIGILHHPLDELISFEAKQIEAMLIKDYDILLCGHVHEGDNWSVTNIYGSTIVSIAPSNWTTNVRSKDLDFANGYSIIDFSKENNVVISHRRYSHRRERFVANTELGDESSSGKTTYQLPNTTENSKRESEYNIIEKIKEVHLASLDQHLISYDTDTKAPKRIEDIFVLPPIVQKEETTIIDEDILQTNEKVFSIEDISGSKENLLLIGAKESGKTILMSKILMDITNNYINYRHIPVYINFEDTVSNRIETIISRYLNIGIHEIKNETLKNHRVILLIDNIKFENKYKALLRNLEDFLRQNPNINVIATCTSNTEGEIPIEALDFAILELFKPAFIKSFRTKEIRDLMDKWFSGNSRFLAGKQELEQLIKTLGTLNISRTPLAISMFLWIIEKQENYAPVNNAQMLENFLERLFTKTSINEVYSSDFNYLNKVRLLSEIALFMYGENQLNYSISYQVLRNFIYENLKIKKFDFDEEMLLQHFIQKGIFTVEKQGLNRIVKFKFACFFQFFLMKNIDRDEDFKRHVLSEEHFLHFVNELDYYSGLHIDDAELLKLTVDRMHEEFKPFLSKIESIQYTYDNQFETLNTLIEHLSHSDIDKYTSEEYKQTDKDIEREHDIQLSDKEETRIINKDNHLNPIVKFERLWILAAKVLKNTEEITVENLKADAFTKILKCSIAFATIYKHLINKYMENQQDDDEKEIEHFQVMNKILPVIHQILVYQTLGTGKLSIVLEEKIENIMDDESTSDFEKFLCVFIYSDLKGKNKLKYINQLISNTKRYYIKDMIFMKLIEYYNRKDTSKNEENHYKNLLGDLIIRDDGQTTERRDFHKKGRFIQRLEKIKREKEVVKQSEAKLSN